MRANPMTFSADTASTHVGWRQSGSDADADHLLIRGDWGEGSRTEHPSESSGEPVLRFLGDNDAGENPAADQAPTAATAAEHDSAFQLDAEFQVNNEMDVEVNDAAVDAPPYLWGGEALVPDSVSGPSETVFS